MFGEAHKSAADDRKCVQGFNWSVVSFTVQKKVGQWKFTFSRTEFIWKDFVYPPINASLVVFLKFASILIQ